MPQKPQKAAIRQQADMGCGIACVAFLTGRTYAEINDPYPPTDKGIAPKKLARMLSTLTGRAYAAIEFRKLPMPANWPAKWADIDENSVVLVNRYPGDKSCHYLARHKGWWMDSWINLDASKGTNDVARSKSGWRSDSDLPPEWRPLAIVKPV